MVRVRTGCSPNFGNLRLRKVYTCRRSSKGLSNNGYERLKEWSLFVFVFLNQMYLPHKRCSIAVPRGRHVHLNDPLISPYHKPSPPRETESFTRPAEWPPKLPAVGFLHSWCTAKCCWRASSEFQKESHHISGCWPLVSTYCPFP